MFEQGVGGMTSQREQAQQRSIQAARRHWVGSIVVGIIGAIILAVAPYSAAQAMPLSGVGGNTPALAISSPNPPSGPAGALVVVSGSHWVPSTTVQLSIGTSSGSCATTTAVDGASATVDNTGAVTISFTWPNSLTANTYPICGDGPGAPSGGVKSSNSFTELTSATPLLSITPTTATSGSTVSITGSNWVPSGTVVEIHGGPQGGNLCANLLATLTSQGDPGTITGSFTVPTVSSPTNYIITASSPAGTCSGTPAPTLHTTTTLTIDPSGNAASTPTPGTGNTPTPGTGTGGTPTPTSGHATATPTPGHATPAPGSTQVPEPNRTPTPTRTPGSGGGGGSGTNTGPCPPLPGNFCNANSSFPGWLLCLMVLGLLALFAILLLLLLWRRNQEVIVTEEDITNQIDPNGVAQMGTMRFVRAVRVTTQVVDRKTGNVRSSRVRDYDEFVDASGNIHRRPRTAPTTLTPPANPTTPPNSPTP